jgi:putative hydrolase of the HAD superfamily
MRAGGVDHPAREGARLAALLIDFGGVMTSNVYEAFAACCAAEGLPPERFRTVLASDDRASRIFVEVETGAMSEAEFERAFAPMLGPGVAPRGLLERLTAELRPEPSILAAIATLREAGVATVLVSNTFGRTPYASYDLEGLFDHVVLSADVGIRKPSRAIYRHAIECADRLPEEALFVDDLEHNLAGARRVGLRTHLHSDPVATVAALESLFGVTLDRQPPTSPTSHESPTAPRERRQR